MLFQSRYSTFDFCFILFTHHISRTFILFDHMSTPFILFDHTSNSFLLCLTTCQTYFSLLDHMSNHPSLLDHIVTFQLLFILVWSHAKPHLALFDHMSIPFLFSFLGNMTIISPTCVIPTRPHAQFQRALMCDSNAPTCVIPTHPSIYLSIYLSIYRSLCGTFRQRRHRCAFISQRWNLMHSMLGEAWGLRRWWTRTSWRRWKCELCVRFRDWCVSWFTTKAGLWGNELTHNRKRIDVMGQTRLTCGVIQWIRGPCKKKLCVFFFESTQGTCVCPGSIQKKYTQLFFTSERCNDRF